MGPLKGTRFLEIAGIGPGPFCGMLLADLGADVIAVHRPGAGQVDSMNITERGKRSIFLDLKDPDDVSRLLKLCTHADGLFEGFRPGVMERLGLGPEECQKHNPQLVYGRISGWGQSGPKAKTANHDINFLAAAGILDLVRARDGHPTIPVNIIGDYAGGSLFMAFGLLAAIIEAQRSGRGQVVDLAVSEGTAALAMIYFCNPRESFVRQMLTAHTPFYQVYATSDGRHISVGSIEPQFYAAFLGAMGLEGDPNFADQFDSDRWPAMIEVLSQRFGSATFKEWKQRFENVDACVFPVNLIEEVPEDPQMKARNAFVTIGGVTQPAPTPRFSATPASIPYAPRAAGADTAAVFAEFGLK